MLAQVKRSCLELMGGCHACQAESCVALLNFTASLECFRLLWHDAFIVRSGFYLASFSQLPSLFLLKQCQLRVSVCMCVCVGGVLLYNVPNFFQKHLLVKVCR